MRRVDGSRLFLRYLAVVPLLLTVMFLGFSPAASIVFVDQPRGLAGAEIGNPKRVVMIVVDELPLETLLDGSGAVDAELYPNFARLAGSSSWYRNTTTVNGFTELAVPAIATGRYPSDPKAVPSSADYPDTIFRLLGGAYRMNVHEAVTHLCPNTVCVESLGGPGATSGGLTSLLEQTKDLWWEFANPRPSRVKPLALPVDLGDRTLAGRKFVRSLTRRDTPTFDFLHLLLPHQPWRYLSTLQDTGYPSEDLALRRANVYQWGSQWAADIGRERHVLQVQAVDTILGQVFDRLERIGAWDDSLVVVTADHGAAFTVGDPIRWVGDQNAPEILWTPLFVKAPGQRVGAVDDRPVESIDVMPTIADQLGIKIPWEVDGVSVSGRPRPESPRRFAQWDLATPKAPPGVPFAKDGQFLEFDGGVLFPQVLGARAVAPGSDPGLRPYRIGPYAELIGRSPDGLVDPRAPGPTSVSIGDAARFDNVDPAARSVPWTWIEGRAVGARADQSLAVAVNGRIAGLSSTDKQGSGEDGYYLVALSPAFFQPGGNEIRVFAISGTPDRPALRELPISRPGAPAAVVGG